jgi:hypothetical protein
MKKNEWITLAHYLWHLPIEEEMKELLKEVLQKINKNEVIIDDNDEICKTDGSVRWKNTNSTGITSFKRSR